MSEKGILGVYKSQLKEDEKKYKGEFHVFFNYLHLSANYGKWLKTVKGIMAV